MPITVVDCIIYPLKSAGGISVREIAVTPRGFENDRLCMLVDADGKFVTQRSHAKLATLSVRLENQNLRFSFGNDTLSLTSGDWSQIRQPVTVWKDNCEAVAAQATVNDWFSRHLDIAVTLVRMPDDVRRNTDPTYSRPGDHVSFADGYPILVAAMSSLDALTPHFASAITMDRFRPNIVLSGSDAFAEDIWHHIKIGEIELELVKPCARCVITTIDQKDSSKPSKEPLTTLAALRRGAGGVYFGENAIPRKLGMIRVGDTVEILSTKPLAAALTASRLNGLRPAL